MKLAIHMNGKSVRGSEVQCFLIASAMQASGHEVVVACRKNGPVRERARELGIRTASAIPRGDGDFVSALLFAKWLRRGRFDVVLLTSWKKVFMASWSARMARVPRVVLRIGGPHPVRAGVRGWKYRRALTHQVDSIICNSPELAQAMLAAVPGVASRNMHVIMNGIDDSWIAENPSHGVTPASGDRVHCVAVGGLEANKGFDVLLDAFAAARPDAAHLSIIGGGPELGALRDRADRLGVGEAVSFRGHRTDVREILSTADVFVLSSRTDSIPVALLEAMAAGVPVIATRVPGVREAIQAVNDREAAGWAVPVDDVNALADALRKVIGMVASRDPAIEARTREAKWRIDNWFRADRMTRLAERVLLGAR